jgi:hypothetical protein
MAGETGTEFYAFLQECAQNPDFAVCTDSLSQSDRDQREDEELVLRFFALKNARDLFRGSIRDWLDEYMEQVVLGRLHFAYRDEKVAFERVFRFLNTVLGEGAFVRYRDGRPIGGLAPAYFESVSIGAWRAIAKVEGYQDVARLKATIIGALQTEEFRSQVGPGANSMAKLTKRVQIIEEALSSLVS